MKKEIENQGQMTQKHHSKQKLKTILFATTGIVNRHTLIIACMNKTRISSISSKKCHTKISSDY